MATNFLVVRYMTPEGDHVLNQYGFDLDIHVFETVMQKDAVLQHLSTNRLFRNSVLLLKEYLESHPPSYGPGDVLWATPGITDVGVAALWTLGIHRPIDIIKLVKEAANSSINPLDLTRELYRKAVQGMDLTPEEQREVWVGIMMALSYWNYATPGQVIGPSIGLKP